MIVFDLYPDETQRLQLKKEGAFAYTVKAGSKTMTGTVIVSARRRPSADRIILIQANGLEAVEPLVIPINRYVAWTNEYSGKVKVSFDY
jgi:hypothetical protein